MTQWKRLGKILILSTFLMIGIGTISFAQSVPEVFSEGDKWELLWEQSNGEKIFYKKDSVVPLKTPDGSVVYRAEMASLWSREMLDQILDQAEEKNKLPKKEITGAIYRVELNMSRWSYRIQSLGPLGIHQNDLQVKETSESPWRSLVGNRMNEPLAVLAIEIYENREIINRKEKENLSVPLEGKMLSQNEEPWIEFDQGPWGRYFFLPSEVRKKTIKSSSEEQRELFQVLIRSDWSQRAKKEAPEIENWIRQREKRSPISHLEKTEIDYMIWCLDLKKRERSYMAGVYLDQNKTPIFKEGNFMSFYWNDWGDPMMGGALAAYLLAHPNWQPEEEDPSPQVEISKKWAGDDLFEGREKMGLNYSKAYTY